MSDMQPKYPAPADEVLCDRAAQGDPAAEEELAGRYARLVRACARPLFLAGAWWACSPLSVLSAESGTPRSAPMQKFVSAAACTVRSGRPSAINIHP